MAKIDGTSGNDTITPAVASPGVTGKTTGGADEVDAKAGNDSIDAGGGADSIDGGTGNDTIKGGSGADRIQGGLTSSSGNDSVDGGDGADTLDGGQRNDTLSGGGGNDSIDDTYGDDSISGGAGGDTIVAYDSDTIDGGDGNDLILGSSHTDPETVFRGGAGIDTLRYSNRADLSNFSYATTSVEIFDGGGYDISGTGGNDVLDFRGVTLINVGVISGGFGSGAGDDFIAGNDAANIIAGSGGENTILGGGGNDTIISGIAASTAEFAESLDGGDGRDTIDYHPESTGRTIDLLAGTATTGAVVDTILGFEDVIGSNSSDLIRGSTIGNVLDGGSGNDTILGLAGNDTIIGAAGTDSLDGGTGTDTVDYSFASGDAAGGTIDLGAGSATIGGITETILNFENANGSQRADLITGKNGSNRLSGFGGRDTLVGLDGDDTLNGGAANDSLVGGQGNDTYILTDTLDSLSEQAGQGVDTVQCSASYTLGANLENLALSGAAAINGTGNGAGNVLTGNAAANTLSGLGGADTLVGGGGADTLIGGIGADRFDFNAISDSASDARDVIQGFDAPGAAAGDRIDLADVFGGTLSFIGSAGFSAAGQVRVIAEGTNTRVLVNTGGMLVADMDILIVDGATPFTAYTEADFSL